MVASAEGVPDKVPTVTVGEPDCVCEGILPVSLELPLADSLVIVLRDRIPDGLLVSPALFSLADAASAGVPLMLFVARTEVLGVAVAVLKSAIERVLDAHAEPDSDSLELVLGQLLNVADTSELRDSKAGERESLLLPVELLDAAEKLVKKLGDPSRVDVGSAFDAVS
jgi:hypothetical protein